MAPSRASRWEGSLVPLNDLDRRGEEEDRQRGEKENRHDLEEHRGCACNFEPVPTALRNLAASEGVGPVGARERLTWCTNGLGPRSTDLRVGPREADAPKTKSLGVLLRTGIAVLNKIVRSEIQSY
jgi:hypothetical protein